LLQIEPQFAPVGYKLAKDMLIKRAPNRLNIQKLA